MTKIFIAVTAALGTCLCVGGCSSGGDGALDTGTEPDIGGDTNPSDGGAPPVQEPQLPEVTGDCPVFETGIVSVGGLDDVYLQVGPKENGPGPLLFYWHGTASSSDEVDVRLPASVRDDILASGGVIAAFDGSVGTGDNCSGTGIFRSDDFDVADQIAACAVRDHGIDPRRIYTTGCSAGGLQSGCMGIRRPAYIAATVPNSGGMVFDDTFESGAFPPAVMTLHGGESDVVIVSFADTSLKYDELMQQAGSFVVNCDHGGGHCDAPPELYEAAWTFMKAHPYGTSPSPYTAGLPASFPAYCEIF